MEWVTNKSSGNSDGTGDNIVRLRGLPFDCTEPDIVKFFQGENSITFFSTLSFVMMRSFGREDPRD